MIEIAEKISKRLADLKFAELQLLSLRGIKDAIQKPDIDETLKVDLTLYHTENRIAFARLAVPKEIINLGMIENYWIGQKQQAEDDLDTFIFGE